MSSAFCPSIPRSSSAIDAHQNPQLADLGRARAACRKRAGLGSRSELRTACGFDPLQTVERVSIGLRSPDADHIAGVVVVHGVGAGTMACIKSRTGAHEDRGVVITSEGEHKQAASTVIGSTLVAEVEADPSVDGTRSGTFVVLHPARTELVIGGTFYAGEIKKSIFTVLNDRLPLEGVLPMHCSANVSQDGENVAIFFGLSGTGKTTLSADPSRLLIGDDEHGWGDNGVFNFEGGCYAKTIRLSPSAEPEIWKASHAFGTILENVAIDDRGFIDLDDASKTENTRAAYKLEQIASALPTKMAGHPQNVIFLTADAFGILPPIARLSRRQALYYFLSGFTAKLAGTEIGVTEPQPTFSTCFGAPFLPQRPSVYADMLGKKLDKHGANRVAREHGLDRRPVRRRARGCRSRRRAHCFTPLSRASSTTSSSAPTRSSASRCRSRCRASSLRFSIRGRPGAILRRTTGRRASSLAMFRENFKKFADAGSPRPRPA